MTFPAILQVLLLRSALVQPFQFSQWKHHCLLLFTASLKCLGPPDSWQSLVWHTGELKLFLCPSQNFEALSYHGCTLNVQDAPNILQLGQDTLGTLINEAVNHTLLDASPAKEIKDEVKGVVSKSATQYWPLLNEPRQ